MAETSDQSLEVVERALAVATRVAPLPWWIPRWLAGWVAALLVGAVVAIAEQLDVGELLRAWADSVRPGMEPPPGSPPMDMPPGGMPVPPPTRQEGDP